MATDGQELIQAALASVEDRVQQQIDQAGQRREREKQQRAERLAARSRGLARRHAAKLRNLAGLRSPDGNAGTGDTPTTTGQRPAGPGAVAPLSTDCQPDSLTPNDTATVGRPSSSSLTRARGDSHASTSE